MKDFLEDFFVGLLWAVLLLSALFFASGGSNFIYVDF